MQPRFRQLVFLAVACLPVLAVAQPVPLHDTRPRAGDAQLRQALESVRATHDVPGLAAAVFDRESIRTFGVGELEPGGESVTPESRFRVGQVSLLFSGLAIAALVADGSIPAGGELPRLAPEIDLRNPWSSERPVRIDDLVSHRAGLGATHFRDAYADTDAQPLLAGINSAFRALRLEHPPGEREHYSVIGHAIAAYLVEKTAAKPYEEVLAGLLFEPLDSAASVGRPDGPASSDSHGHTGPSSRPVSPRALNLPPAGDLWISAQDLARVGQVLLDRGRADERELLPAAAIDWLESLPEDALPLTPGSRRGVRAEEFDGFVFYTQTGALPGFLSRFAYSPALGRGYVLLLNRGDAEGALRDADALLRGQLFAGSPQPEAVPPPAADSLAADTLAGWYRDVTPAHPPERLYQSWLGFMNVVSCDDALCLSSLGASRVLKPFDAVRLREPGRWQPGWRWQETGAGHVLETADARWQPVAGWRVLFAVLAGLFICGAMLLGVVLLPVWSWSLVRRRITSYHALVPRFVPLAAVLVIVALQVMLFVTDYPALGQVSAPSVTILVLSLLAPALSVLGLAAAFAGLRWKLSYRTFAAALYLALAANGAVIAMAVNDLVAFQTWNY